MGTTTNYALPYPENTNDVDVTIDIQGLAQSVDSVLNSQKLNKPGLVTVNALARYSQADGELKNSTIIVDDTGLVTGARLDNVGNLLTDNQASGGDTLGTTEGFNNYANCTLVYSTDDAYSGNGCIRLTTTANGSGTVSGVTAGRPTVVEGQVYTVSMWVKPSSTRTYAPQIWTYRADNNAYLANVNSGYVTVPGGQWTRISMSGVMPADAGSAIPVMAFGADHVAGDVVYIDNVGLWKGAGGEWAMPGTPIVNQGRRVTHPNGDDVLVEVWDSGLGRWQRTHYDSGWRDITGLLINGWTCANWIRMRRVNNTVSFEGYGINGSASTNNRCIDVGVINEFPAAIAGVYYPCGVDNAGTPTMIHGQFNNGIVLSEIGGQGTDITNGSISFTGQGNLGTPTSLPGTLVSAAPAAASLDVPDTS